MKSREFNKLINVCSKRAKLDLGKVKALDDNTRHDMALHIIRNRGPVLVELLTSDIEESWLNSMGYLYQTKGESGYTFRHTCEHIIK